MNNDKIVLKNNTEIPLESSQGIGALHVAVNSKQEACAFWEQFTSDNLKQVIIKNQDGLTVGNYQDMVLDYFRGEERADGTILATFSLRGKSDMEIMKARLSVAETTIQTHGETIGDISEELTGTQLALTETYELIGGIE